MLGKLEAQVVAIPKSSADTTTAGGSTIAAMGGGIGWVIAYRTGDD